MKWALALLGVTLFALVGWAMTPALMLVALVGCGAWCGWKRWRAGAADRELRRFAREWARARRERERRESERHPIEPSRPWPRGGYRD